MILISGWGCEADYIECSKLSIESSVSVTTMLSLPPLVFGFCNFTSFAPPSLVGSDSSVC